MHCDYRVINESNIRALSRLSPEVLESRFGLTKPLALELYKAGVECSSFRAIFPAIHDRHIGEEVTHCLLSNEAHYSTSSVLKTRQAPLFSANIGSVPTTTYCRSALSYSSVMNRFINSETCKYLIKVIAYGADDDYASMEPSLDRAIKVARALLGFGTDRVIAAPFIDRYETAMLGRSTTPSLATSDQLRHSAVDCVSPFSLTFDQSTEDIPLSDRAENIPEIFIEPTESIDNSFTVDGDGTITYLSVSSSGILTKETKHDLNVKYSDCFGLYNEKTVYVKEFGNKRNTIYVRYDEVSNSYLTEDIKQATYSTDFNFVPPVLGAINFEHYVLYIERVHRKPSPGRYRKALRRDLIEIAHPYAGSLSASGYSNVDVIYSDNPNTIKWMMDAILRPVVFTYNEAIASILSFGRIAAAFSPDYHAGFDFATNKIVMYKAIKPIGTYNLSTEKWDMCITSFNNELLEMGVPL